MMMKKTLSLLLALAMLVLSLPALADAVVDPAPYLGAWRVVSMTEDGQTRSSEESKMLLFKEGGTAIEIQKNRVTEHSWYAAPEGLAVHDEENSIFKVMLQEDSMLLRYDDETNHSIVLERAAIVDPAPYMGTWQLLSKIEDGQVTAPTESDMEETVVIQEDGTVIDIQNDFQTELSWYAAPEGLMLHVNDFDMDYALLVLQDDGTILLINMTDFSKYVIIERVPDESLTSAE